MSISRGNVPFLGRFPRLIDTFCWWWRTFYWQSCKLGPCWIWKTTWTTFTTCNNLHASRVTILLHGKQQNTTLRLERASLLSWRNGSISWYPFSSWHNLNKLSSAHDLPSVVTFCKGCSSCFPMCPRRTNIHDISKHSATFFGPPIE